MKTILIVEDQWETMAIHSVYLERHGYRVIKAENGEEGVDAARRDLPDLILMDLSVPRLDGFGATEALKRDPDTGHIPIVIMTAHAYGSVGRRAVAAGCDGFLAKPLDPRRVLEEVRNRIGPGGKPN
ncbi:MAG TPA: response regulator [Longimicrobiaceae bacterium]|jgi:two-component system cell cycle response regulator DivK